MSRKTLLMLVMLTGAFLLCTNLHAQELITGKWKAYCAPKYMSHSEMCFLEFCPTEYTENALRFLDFSWEIDEEFIRFTVGNQTDKIPYRWDEMSVTLEFTYKDKDYLFNVFIPARSCCADFILQNHDGMIMHLERIKPEEGKGKKKK